MNPRDSHRPSDALPLPDQATRQAHRLLTDLRRHQLDLTHHPSAATADGLQAIANAIAATEKLLRDLQSLPAPQPSAPPEDAP